MADQKPGDGVFGWLGRQIGHVKKAVQTQVVPPADAVHSSPTNTASNNIVDQVVFRKDSVEEVPHPTQPDVKLRRTVIDEVIVEKKKD